MARSRAPAACSTAAEQAFFDAVEGLTFLNEIAFFEQHRFQVAFYPRPDLDPVDRFNTPDEIGRLRDRLALGVDRADRDRGRLPALRTRRSHQRDFLVHSIAFSPKEALGGRVIDVGRDGFITTMDISCWSFIRMAHLAEPLMKNGGAIFTMTYYGSQMVVENYNIMGVAKAALESAVHYIAAELGPKGIRVHAISPGPLATRAASGIPEFNSLLEKAQGKAPTRRLVTIEDVGFAVAFLAHEAAKAITGDTLYVDGGYHIID